MKIILILSSGIFVLLSIVVVRSYQPPEVRYSPLPRYTAVLSPVSTPSPSLSPTPYRTLHPSYKPILYAPSPSYTPFPVSPPVPKKIFKDKAPYYKP